MKANDYIERPILLDDFKEKFEPSLTIGNTNGERPINTNLFWLSHVICGILIIDKFLSNYSLTDFDAEI